MIPSRVTLVDVGPRDGLQNEKQTVDAAVKIELVHRLQAAGLREIEVDQLRQPEVGAADGRQRRRARRHREEARRPLLGADPEHEGARRGAVGAARAVARRDRRLRRGDRGVQPEEHQLLDRREHRALPAGRRRGERRTASRCAARSRCALGCPYQGEVSADEVERVVRLIQEIGVDHCGVCDTIGVGTPKRVQAAIERALKHYPARRGERPFPRHLRPGDRQRLRQPRGRHRRFDASVAGLGGCPYAKGATGNVATEDVLFLLDGLGIDTGVSLDGVVDAAAFISGVLGRKPVSRTGNALLAKRAAAAPAACS